MWAADTWVKTAPSDLQTGDVVVVVDQTSSKAMSHASLNSKNAPNAVAVTLKADKSEITSEVEAGIQWSLTTTGSGDSKTFKLSKDASNHLNVTADNNGVRVGNGDRNTFTIVTGGDNNGYYLTNTSGSDTRYIGCYNNTDWRCYTSINNNIKGNDIAFYKKTTASGPVDPVLSISKSTIPTGNTATITAPVGLTVSYESDDTSIATVNAEGVVTAVKAGAATITATWSAVADTYNAGSKDFDITVVDATVYVKVTNSNQLVAGNKYILVATGYSKAMGEQDGNIRGYVDITIDENTVTIVDEAVAVMTLGGQTDEWTFLTSDNDEYLAYSGSSNQVHSNADATADASKWKVTNDFQLESANVSGRVLKYNAGSPRFACYSSGQQAAVLFVKEGSNVSSTLTLASACTDGTNYYGTYSNDMAFIVPADLTVSAVEVADGKLVVTSYETGDVVKANTGVMVSAATAGEHTVVLTAAAGTEIDGNMLKASGDAGIDAATMNEANTNFYRLTMHNGTEIGFWWGAASGASFDLAANKAYLAVPAAAAREGFAFADDETTAIKNLTPALSQGEGAVYDLQGRRVAQPQKGLYIVNGKKVVIK